MQPRPQTLPAFHCYKPGGPGNEGTNNRYSGIHISSMNQLCCGIGASWMDLVELYKAVKMPNACH